MSRTRTSVELHPDGWRLVEVELPASDLKARLVASLKGRAAGGKATAGDVRVTTFLSQTSERDDTSMASLLQQIRTDRKLSRDVWVTVWGLRTTQQLLRLPPAKTEALEALARREARKDLAPFESDVEGASVTVVPGQEVMVGAQRRREVSLVAASTAEIKRRIQPLIDAGFVVRGVLTPALALAAVARSHSDATPATAAYVAILGQSICLAIVRGGLLLFAREIPWGHASAEFRPKPDGSGDPIETRLASELKRSVLFFKQTFRSPVEAIVLCGDMPNLRSLTAPLGEALSVPVQTLDSLVGLDAANVPQPAERFRAEVASLRIPIAAAAEQDPPANLLPVVIRRVRESHVQKVRLALGTAASVLLVGGWYYLASQTARHQQVEIQAIERQLAILEPDAVRASELRTTYTRTIAQQAALTAMESQGPRLTRLLEVLAQSTPEDVVITALDVQPDGAYWRARVTGLAVNEDAANAQASINALLEALSQSPFAGAPVQSPSRRIVTGRGADASGELVPPGMTGVEFVAELRLAK